jgi:Tfp pilus assembly protein PilX
MPWMSKTRRTLADEGGFTLVTVTIAMMILSLFTVGAWAAANSDLPTGRKDLDRKRALEAAQAGLQWYSSQLQRDTNFWSHCTNAGVTDQSQVPSFVQLQGTRNSWRSVIGSDTDVTATPAANRAQFALEEMVAPSGSKTTCGSDPSATLLADGVLRIRSTGSYNGRTRQVVGTFRRSGFLDYVWYTKWETQSPLVYSSTDQVWAANNCGIGRNTRAVNVARDAQRGGSNRTCKDLQFPNGDQIRGPMHTEDDSLYVCDSPRFGRSTADKIEILGATTRSNASTTTTNNNNNGCGNSPDWRGTVAIPAKSVDLPDSNTSMSTVADLKYTGTTCLEFRDGGQMNVYTNLTCTGSPSRSVSLSGDTTIWVSSTSGGCSAYAVTQTYVSQPSCGNVGVKGTYSNNITVGSDNDIVVVGDLTHSGTALMGLVANQFVRVYHPVVANCGDNSGNGGNSYVNNIDAAILATQGSFLADNAVCGDYLGQLHILGAIAQKWRGIIGQTYSTCSRSGCSTSQNGYLKDYNYDDRLKYREPPNFLDPVTVTWNLLRQSEQTPVQTG